jgi:hypothetical protein
LLKTICVKNHLKFGTAFKYKTNNRIPMNKRKGMSQVLSLIVGASVLMMVGLSLTVITQGSITDLISGQDSQSCLSTIQTQCNSGESQVRAPASCSESFQYNGNRYSPGDTITCDEEGGDDNGLTIGGGVNTPGGDQ